MHYFCIQLKKSGDGAVSIPYPFAPYFAGLCHQFSTYRKWNYIPVLLCACVFWAEMYI